MKMEIAPMNILLNAPDLGLPGGVSKYCSVIRSHFNSNIEYFTIGKKNINDSVIRKTVLAVNNYFNFFKTLQAIDLVHINTSLGTTAVIRDGIFLLIAKLCGKKVVVFFHGWDDNCELRIRRFFLLPFRLIYFRADAIIVLATIFKNRLIEMGYSKNIHLETTTVEDAMFTHAATVSAMLEEKTDRNAVNILYLSRIEKAKGIYEAIDAYALLKKRRSQVRLTIVGEGVEFGRVRDYVANKEITDVYFKGHLSGQAIREAFVAADIYLFPTWYGEGLPISILEAMVYGLPVLTRPVGGIPDFFQDLKMGYITESREPEIFAELLEQLIDNPGMRRVMGNYNHSYAQEHFRPSIIAERLEKIYRNVLGREPSCGNTQG
jgi:glycosyltransferase involved in cell wall biosynthesis